MNIRKLALLLFLTAALGFSASRKVSRDLAALPPDQQVTVIVRYTHQLEARHQLNIARRGGRAELHVGGGADLDEAARPTLEKQPWPYVFLDTPSGQVAL